MCSIWPKKSMIRFLLDQGLDVFITSWKNPDASMRGVTFDDYLLEGVHAAVEVARALTGAPKVHAVGYCIGGTALAMYMAWANRRFAPDEVPVADWTLLTTLVDFREPGEIEVFIDESSIRSLCDSMAQKGYLDGREMAASFRLLRSNSLIWHYVVNGWLYGETPPPFDVLYWNMDATRMPQAMHSWYLRELYLHNQLVKPDALTVAGEPLDLRRITQPLYSVAAEDDHIAPWQQAFRINRHLAGDKRFVLSSSGHILGIVNPVVVPPKRSYRAADVMHRSDRAEGWQAGAEVQQGSWWEDWMQWLKPRAGKRVKARAVATADFPELAPAPGTYVMER
jgi:polyhydroxyalkanoate synthase